MTKQFIEIEIPGNADPFDVRDKLKLFHGIAKSYPVTFSKLRIYYDDKKMPVERLIKIVKNGGKEPKHLTLEELRAKVSQNKKVRV